jgi:hypothetical protein
MRDNADATSLPPLSDVLERVRRDQQSAGELFRNGARADEIAGLRADLRMVLTVELPDDYANFLRLADGVDFDGIVFYGTASDPAIHTVFGLGLVAANRLWRRTGENNDVLILGEDDMHLFVVSIATGTVERRDRVTAETTERFPGITAMITQVLHRRFG